MVEKNGDDWLDQMMMVETPHIPDDGFTDGVLRELPGPRVKMRLRAFILITALVVGGFLGLFVLPSGAVISSVLGRVFMPETWLSPLEHFNVIVSALLLTAALVCGGLITALSDR